MLGVPLELSPVCVYKDIWVTQALLEKYLELVPLDQDKVVCVMFPFVLLSAEADAVPEEERGKGNPDRPRNSSGSKIVLTLLTEVVVVYVGLSVVYVRGISLQLFPWCLGNNGSWSGSGNKSRSGNSSLQNSLILKVFGDTSSSEGVSDGGFRLQGSSRLVGQFVSRLGRWRGIKGSDGGSGGEILMPETSVASNWGYFRADLF